MAVVISNSLVFPHEFLYLWKVLHIIYIFLYIIAVDVLLQRGNESRIPVMFVLNTRYYYSVQCTSSVIPIFQKADRWERDRQSIVETWEVLGRKYGEVNLPVLPEGVLAMKIHKLEK